MASLISRTAFLNYDIKEGTTALSIYLQKGRFEASSQWNPKQQNTYSVEDHAGPDAQSDRN